MNSLLRLKSSFNTRKINFSANRIKNVLLKQINENVEISGWVKTKRTHKNLTFIEVNDGSNLNGIQVTQNFI